MAGGGDVPHDRAARADLSRLADQAAVEADSEGRGPQGRDPSGVGAELPLLWRPPDLQAAAPRGKKRYTTIPDEAAPRPADLVERRFVASRPNELWLADITYASMWDGWLHVAFILDVHSRMIVGWQLADHLRTDLVLDALEMALWRRDLTFGDLIHHSDRVCQYTSFRYSDRLAEAGVAASVGSKGDSYANAMAEALNGTFKSELVKLHGPWRTRGQLEIAIIEWIDWYNAVCLHREIGDIPTAEHEADWYRHNPTSRQAVTT